MGKIGDRVIRSACGVVGLAALLTLTAPAHADIVYTCSAAVATSTCNYLNTTVAGMYSSTFTDANADIYITYGSTALAETTAAFNMVTYNQYVTALAANTSKSAVQVSALASLNANDSAPYGSGDVNITASLASALGLSGITNYGVTTGDSTCTLGFQGCYDADITVTNSPGTPLYFDNQGGQEASGAYDFYATVEHETDEVLGTASCMTTGGGKLTDACDYAGSGTPSAVDLFRYYNGNLALNSTYDGSSGAPAGAYFSYNGGLTNGVNGAGGSPKYYNALANGDDYADFVASSPNCGANQAVQDAVGCPGQDAGLNIQNDGRGEITILNAVGYDLAPTSAPEPGTLVLFGTGFGVLALYVRRRA
jgi:hypothetical protein